MEVDRNSQGRYSPGSLKEVLVNDRSYFHSWFLIKLIQVSNWERCLFCCFVFFFISNVDRPRNPTDWLVSDVWKCVVLSAHPTLISSFIYLCSRVRQLTSSCSHVSAAHAPTHLCSCSFICTAFCVWFIWVSVFLHAPRFGLKRNLSRAARQFPRSVDTFHIRK